MNESEVKRKIVKEFKDRGHYARRIEDAYSVGFPDLILIPKECPVFFTEVKIFHGNVFKPTERQYVEMKRLAISKYSIPTVLGWKDGIHYLHPYAQKCQVAECVMQHTDENVVDLFRRYYLERQ